VASSFFVGSICDALGRGGKAFVSVEDVTTSTPAMPAEAEEAA